MAWAQVYDGVNDYSGNSLVSAMSGDFTLKYVGQVPSLPMTTFGNILVIHLGSSDYLGVAVQNSGGTLLPKIISNGKTGGNGSTVIALNTDYTLEVRYVSSTNTASFYVDGVFDYSVNPTGGGTWVQTLTDYRFGFSITSSTSYGALLLKDGCEIIDSTTPANSLSFSPTSSSHAAGTPILDETSLNSLDATGVNMPTDGSAWVDLGGSGISIAVTEVKSNRIDISSLSISANLTITTTETRPSRVDLSTLSVAGNVLATVTEVKNSRADNSSVTIGVSALSILVTEIKGSRVDLSSIDIKKEIDLIVTEIKASRQDFSLLNIPVIITINPKNIIRVKRKENTVRVKRNSNIIRVK